MMDIEPNIIWYWKEHLESAENMDLCLAIEEAAWGKDSKPAILILRGLPGSGKSTFAAYLQKMHGFRICEADSFMMENGVYKFDPKKLNYAHTECRNLVRDLMVKDENIVVSNTSTQRWEMEPYIQLAQEFGYTVLEHTLTTNFGNIHGVPPEKVEIMKKRWED